MAVAPLAMVPEYSPAIVGEACDLCQAAIPRCRRRCGANERPIEIIKRYPRTRTWCRRVYHRRGQPPGHRGAVRLAPRGAPERPRGLGKDRLGKDRSSEARAV